MKPLTFFDFHLTPPDFKQNPIREKTKIRPRANVGEIGNLPW